jgi:hypothetical protein
VHKRIISAVKRVGFVSDTGVNGVLNVHAPREDKIDDVKDSFCEELGCVFN